MVQPELIRFVGPADVLHVEHGFTGKYCIKTQEDFGNVPVKVVDMEVCHVVSKPVVCQGWLVYAKA
jgi:hypothetical protein